MFFQHLITLDFNECSSRKVSTCFILDNISNLISIIQSVIPIIMLLVFDCQSFKHIFKINYIIHVQVSIKSMRTIVLYKSSGCICYTEPTTLLHHDYLYHRRSSTRAGRVPFAEGIRTSARCPHILWHLCGRQAFSPVRCLVCECAAAATAAESANV